jgi:hypothetical protein
MCCVMYQGAISGSKWAAYVASMGPNNPCGWAKSLQQLAADHQAYLHTLGLDESWWKYFVAQVRRVTKLAVGASHMALLWLKGLPCYCLCVQPG